MDAEARQSVPTYTSANWAARVASFFRDREVSIYYPGVILPEKFPSRSVTSGLEREGRDWEIRVSEAQSMHAGAGQWDSGGNVGKQQQWHLQQ